MMSLFRPVRDELFKYRKRKKKPIDGSVPGIPYARYRKSRRYVSGLPYVPRGPKNNHNPYNWGIPGGYHPRLNAPSVDWTEYDSYEPLHVGRIPKHNHPRSTHDFDDGSQQMPIPPSLPQDDLTQTEQFLMAMGRRDNIEQALPEGPRFNINEPDLRESVHNEPQLPGAESSIDELPSLEVLKEAFLQLSEALPEDHPDLVNIRTAIHRVRDYHLSSSEVNEPESDPLQFDPFQEAEQFFNRQMDILERSFDSPLGPTDTETQGVFEEQAREAEQLLSGNHLDVSLSERDCFGQDVAQDPFEASLPESVQDYMTPDEISPNGVSVEGQTLDGIVEQEDAFNAPSAEFMEQDMTPDGMNADMGMPRALPESGGYDASAIADEINQAIDEVTQQAMPEEIEPDPFEQQQDPYMMGFDQVQYMANPFGMPGPMGPDPMGLPGQITGPMPGP
jgi:hypothetical protein